MSEALSNFAGIMSLTVFVLYNLLSPFFSFQADLALCESLYTIDSKMPEDENENEFVQFGKSLMGAFSTNEEDAEDKPKRKLRVPFNYPPN